MANLLLDEIQKYTGPIFKGGGVVQDAVSIKIGTRYYEGWQNVSITRSIDSLAHTFSIGVADKWRQTKEVWPIQTGLAVSVYIGTKLVINGFIEQMTATVSNEDRSINISGRNKVGDIVDSAAIDQKTKFKNITLKDLAKQYVQDFSLTVKDESATATKVFKEVVVDQGETIYELLMRHANRNGVLLTSDAEGNIIITNAGGGSFQSLDLTDPTLSISKIKNAIGIVGGLFQGKNVLFAEAKFDDTQRFQKYLVKSQIPSNDNNYGKHAIFESIYTDPERVDGSTASGDETSSAYVGRPRTYYYVADSSMNQADCNARAKWEANIRAAKSEVATVTVQGWFDGSGNLWEVNKLVDTDLRFIGFSRGQYLVTEVEFTQDVDSGTTTTLTLGRADSYAVEPFVAKQPKKDAGWTQYAGSVGTSERDRAELINNLPVSARVP